MKKIVSIILTIAVLLSMTISISYASSTTFTDVKTSDWYYSNVNRMISLKLTDGIGNGKFGPANTLTRAEFVTFICRVLNLPQMSGSSYTDIKKHWAEGYITAAQANDIVNKGDKTFRPNAAITRAEAVEMLCRALKVQPDQKMQTQYVDVTTNSGYINAAYSEYLMQGSINTKDNKRYFYPNSTLIRCEAATIIVNMYDYKANREAFIAKQQAILNAAKTEADKYNEWLASFDKGINPSIINNTKWLYSGSNNLYESHLAMEKYLASDECPYIKKCAGTSDAEELKKIYVNNARQAMKFGYNYDYRKIDDLKNGFKTWCSYNFNYVLNNDKYFDQIVKDKIICEGYFYTGEGLVGEDDGGHPAVRGTIKFRYISNNNLPKGMKLNTWYSQDVILYFYEESTGLKVHFWRDLTQPIEVK